MSALANVPTMSSAQVSPPEIRPDDCKQGERDKECDGRPQVDVAGVVHHVSLVVVPISRLGERPDDQVFLPVGMWRSSCRLSFSCFSSGQSWLSAAG